MTIAAVPQFTYRNSPGSRKLTKDRLTSLCTAMGLRTVAGRHSSDNLAIYHPNHVKRNAVFHNGNLTFLDPMCPSTDKILRSLGKRINLKRVA